MCRFSDSKESAMSPSGLLKGVSHEIQRFQRLLVGFLMQKVYITKVFFSYHSLAT